MRLSDSIEEFIKNMMNQDEEEAQFQRSDLAQYFGCTPSQINYVLSTRFTPAHGYVIESHRGGGGCIRIFRMNPSTSDELIQLFDTEIGDEIDEVNSLRIISALLTRGVITERESALMQASVSAQALTIPIPIHMKNALRAKILKQMLLKAVSTH